FDLKGNPNLDRDWWETTLPGTTTKYRFTPAHFAVHEGRFRRHWKEVSEDDAKKLLHLDDMLARLGQDDVVNRRYLLAGHRAFVPDFGAVMQFADDQDRVKWAVLSRQLVLFCVERRKSWRMLQSGAGVDNLDYKAQRVLLGKVDKGELPLADFLAQSAQLARSEQERLAAEKKKPGGPAATK